MNIYGVGLKSLCQMLALYCSQVTSVVPKIDGSKLDLAHTQVYLSCYPFDSSKSQFVLDIIACDTYLDCVTFYLFVLYFLR